jgi:hypothetical protein
LTEEEQHVYRLVREVFGAAILSEAFARMGSEVNLQLALDTNGVAVSSLSLNLTSLAKKQKVDGLSDGALKAGLRF